jgi:hypothetical protein
VTPVFNKKLTKVQDDVGMRYLALILFITACGASPAPEFAGATRADVMRDGRAFTIFYTEKRVEVIRLGYAASGTHHAIRAQMIDIIPQVTGCTLNEGSLQGDSGEMRGSIRCPKK